MGVLMNLEGVKQLEVECTFIKKSSDLSWILRKGHAATTAGGKGAINIWRDDEGYYRCESMRHFVVLDSRRYKYLARAEKWTKKWMKEIK